MWMWEGNGSHVQGLEAKREMWMEVTLIIILSSGPFLGFFFPKWTLAAWRRPFYNYGVIV